MPFDALPTPDVRVVEDDPVLRLLIQGKDRLSRPRGWCKNRYVKSRFFGLYKSYCAIGAIAGEASGDVPNDAAQQAIDALNASAFKIYGQICIGNLNDLRTTKLADILTVYRDAMITHIMTKARTNAV